MIFKANDTVFSYMGRIDRETDREKVLFIYAGSNVRFRFKGGTLKITVKNVPMGEYSAIGAVVDGVQQKIELINDSEEHEYTIAENLGDGEHECTIFKRMGAAHYFWFVSAEAESIVSGNYEYNLKLEFYGDSVSCGEVTEAVYYTSHADPEDHKGAYDNCWFSYTYSLARKLNAEFHNNSQGGLALFNGTGYFCGPEVENLKGLEFTYDKLSYVTYAPMGVSSWDIGQFSPDIVIIAIGQNDAYPDPKAIYDEDYARKWKKKYKEIIFTLKERYGFPKFILINTVLMHDKRWDDVLEEIRAEIGSHDVYHYVFIRNGSATPGHPRIPEQEEMAIELEEFIRNTIFVYR